ncbi:A-kinase anchor protein 14 isoform X2 [Protopterus annectens]|uniref:A-kinase anchor protein 14 isoform X2 n=1 Tax=Protopterus annectens TaxID=7888 RepID=UPI001CFBC059|nr:A-kinase anchor protein 14 isoform X2 [Protopterus annectens]
MAVDLTIFVYYGYKKNMSCVTMDDEYEHILAESANIIINEAMKNAFDHLRYMEQSQERTSQDQNPNKTSSYKKKTMAWTACKDFTVELGKQQIEEFISTWEIHESWLHCIDFLRATELEFSKQYHYQVKWSIPTRRKPIPYATACVYFIIEVSKIKPSTLPVEVYYFTESNRLKHRPNETRFREKWLKDIIESKMFLMETVNF